jgi:hypothetical protein
LTIDLVAKVQAGVMLDGWSVTTINRLSSELSVSAMTVRRCWARAIAWTRRGLDPSKVESMRARQVARLEHNIAAAARAGDYSAAMKGEQVYGQLVGTIQQPGVKVDVNVQHSTTYNAAVAMVSGDALSEQHGQVDRLIASRGRLKPAIEAQSTPVADEPTDVPSSKS